MSHGPSTGGDKCDPNLTPLLDVVLQLLMFFMLCVNFVSEQVNEAIKLPQSDVALPMEKTETDVIFLNLDQEGNLIVTDRQYPLVNIGEKKHYLKQTYEDKKVIADAKKDPNDREVKTLVIIRADKMTNYQQVYELLQACKEAGFRRLSIRAMTKGGPEASGGAH